MATAQTQIRIDKELKGQAVELFNDLGLDMSSAVTLFLRQCIIHQGLPFSIKRPKYSDELKQAIAESELILNNPSKYKGYNSIEEMEEDGLL